MLRILVTALIAALTLVGCNSGSKKTKKVNTKNIQQATHILQNHRQMTFSGKRAGEGYFSADGKTMVFQSEREKSNPFYQIYTMDMKSRKIRRVSNGIGKTTCAWIHPNGKKVLYSSTHQDPKAKVKMQKELAFRESGKLRRYSWDYDENYDIYTSSIRGGKARNLTKTLGYDAEGSFSPDGKHIVFASNRDAYSRDLTPEETEIFKRDKSYFMELYIMDSDGRNVRRLTTSPGYDGGPFFSPDGKSIVWRRFKPDGHSAEVFTMNLATGQETQITRMGAMSWAPFYHPSGDYIVFTSNVYGYSNFELFIVDRKGAREPVRITELDRFDGLPVFTPDGTQLTWNRKLAGNGSQIFTGDWNDSEARKALGLPEKFPMPSELKTEITPDDAKRIVQYLASTDMNGRATGSTEETIYTQKIADYFKQLGLKPIRGFYFQDFKFSRKAQQASGSELTLMTTTQTNLKLNEEWRPLSFSKTGAIAASEIVFAGYGITAPESSDQKAYNSYTGLDVKDKWVMFFRYVPENIDRNRREHLLRYSRLEHKLLVARQLGARGAIIVNGPNAKAKSDLIPFQQASSTDSGLVTITVTTETADKLLASKEIKLKTIQKTLDKEEDFSGFTIPGIKISAQVNIIREKGTARSVFGLLKVPGATRTLIIGAHGDHLGQGKSSSSTMKSSDKTDIHYGADDNASGVAGVLELAHWMTTESKKRRPRHNILFAVWSGEELGNLGSLRFTKRMKRLRINPSAYLNMDMIGRLTDEGKLRPLNIQGVASSPDWPTLIEQNPAPFGIQLSEDPYLPTDAMSFYVAGVPVLNFFTGVHSDYHSPRDTYDKIDYLGLTSTVKYVGTIGKTLAWNGRIPKYNRVQQTQSKMGRGFRIFLGTIPDYSSQTKSGVKLSGVIKGGPAEKAGLQDGDVIVKLSTYDIKTIHDYVYSLESMRPGTPTNITVLRKGKTKELQITPKARQ